MTLVQWTPRPMTIFDEMNDMMTSVFNNDWNTTSDKESGWSPAVDVKETKESYLITLVMLAQDIGVDFEKVIYNLQKYFYAYLNALIKIINKSIMVCNSE